MKRPIRILLFIVGGFMLGLGFDLKLVSVGGIGLTMIFAYLFEGLT